MNNPSNEVRTSFAVWTRDQSWAAVAFTSRLFHSSSSLPPAGQPSFRPPPVPRGSGDQQTVLKQRSFFSNSLSSFLRLVIYSNHLFLNWGITAITLYQFHDSILMVSVDSVCFLINSSDFRGNEFTLFDFLVFSLLLSMRTSFQKTALIIFQIWMINPPLNPLLRCLLFFL